MEKFLTHGIPSSASSVAGPDLHGSSVKLNLLFQDNENLSTIVKCFKDDPFFALVGGALRDFFSGKEINEFDFTTSFSPEKIEETARRNGIRTVRVNQAHDTVALIIDNSTFEITFFRGKDLKEDLLLRDFTLNAIAWLPHKKRFFDPANGISDLKRSFLRAPGNPGERFKEDPLRILRAFRFGYGYGFKIDKDLEDSIIELSSTLSRIKVERIQQELSKLLVTPFAADAFQMMEKLGVLKVILPEIIPTVGFIQNEFHIHDVFEHTLDVMRSTPPDLTLRLAALFHDIAKPHTLSVGIDGKRHFYGHEVIGAAITKFVMERLRFPQDLREAVENLVKNHMRAVDCGPSGVRRILRDLGEQYERWRVFKEADKTPVFSLKEVREALMEFDNKVNAERERIAQHGSKLSINGNDLIALGIPPGPGMGRILKALEEYVIEYPDANTREELLKKAEDLR